MKKQYVGLISCIVLVVIIGAIVYFSTENKGVNGTGIEDSDISLEQNKTNNNDNKKDEEESADEKVDYSRILIGMWHASNQLGDGYNDMYTFNEDGTFRFQYSQYDKDREIVDYSGKWVIFNDNFLTLTIDTKHILDTEVPSGENEQQDNRKVKEIVLVTPEELNYSLNDLEETEESRFPLTIKINGISYWKLSVQQYNDNINASEIEKFTNEKINEFNEAASKAEKTPTHENIIKAHIIGKVFDSLDIEESDRKWIDEKRQFLEDNISSFSVIYSGVSSDNILFIAIVQPQMSNNFDLADLVNDITGTKNEMEILSNIMTIEPDGFYAIDLYAEDLLGTKEMIETDSLKLKFDDEYESFINKDKKEINAYLEVYDRKIKTDLTLSDKSWNLFLFNNKYLDPDEINIQVNGELVKLTK
ncbi:hypothetical protein [Vallitalea guaymasensis]|uniref:Uncharacterized protein n=1 Tax=Vallitalea guaymasensis TaxID=1185412 RepID=A0A8J8MA50_9FIRM|nr:hypothetical protein [Vallitalea guaymasensis]QUH29089.1 hypothetical protein HYG85_09205 [Vallitalea guaymasensis]